VNVASASAILPFETFLEMLRAKGYGVSLHEYAAMATLLGHWDGTNVSEFGDALAALIGRSDDEVEGIRRLFREIYTPPPPPPVVVVPPPVKLPFLRRHAWALAAGAALVLAIGASVAVINQPPDIPTPTPPAVVPEVITANAEQAVIVPPPPEPALPPAPERVERRPASAALGAGFLAALAFFWSMKVREKRRAWLREAWSTMRAALPGPYHFNEIVRDRPARLPKTDVEDAATLLGRVFSTRGLAKALDVPATLRATLRRGLMPTLVSKPRRIAESILVLQDVCQEMRLWDGKVEGFLADLRRQGIALQRMYFDGDLTRVSDRRHRPAVSLESVLRARPDAPVLIIGSGTGLAAMTASDDQRWMRQIAQRLRKTWLTPVADVGLWPGEFNILPLDVWPMTRLGLVNAARQLAGIDAAAGPTVRAQIADEGHVTLQDIERLKRLASLAPHPSPALLDLLRRRFAPDVSDAALLHLMRETGSAGSPIVRLSDSEVARCLAAVRRETPDLEAAARDMILGVLIDSEPIAGSLAHERWQIAIAAQRLAIGDLTGDQPASATATAALAEIAEGPLWDEAREAMAAIPGTAPATRAKADVRKPEKSATTTPPENRRLLSTAGMPWSWPGLRELVPATLVALVILAVALGLNVLPARAVEHLTDVYDLKYDAIPSVSTPQLSVTLKNGSLTVPRTVDLYQGDQLFRSGIAVAGTAPSVVPLASGDTGKYYQARATLRDGNLALSPYVWVTSDQLSFVLVDALPWANVTIVGNGIAARPQQTPFTAALMPGNYEVRFDNPNLSPPSTLNQTLTVPAAGNTIRVTMPGFDAARAVDTLMPRGASKR
jgi:hypothetical protein